MKRCAPAFALLLCFVALDVAQAQITINSVDRHTGCQLVPVEGSPTIWGDGLDGPGPYGADLDVEEGPHQLRSVHDSSVTLDGSGLVVSGSYQGVLSTTDPTSIHYLSAEANLMVSFTPDEPALVDLEVTIPAGGEVYFFDLSGEGEPGYGIDLPGPGTHTFSDTLVAGREYLFQVHYNFPLVPDGPLQVERSAALSMTVVPLSVDNETPSWGGVKAAFR